MVKNSLTGFGYNFQLAANSFKLAVVTQNESVRVDPKSAFAAVSSAITVLSASVIV
ncbi:hypothetical protein D3C81_2266330 [compost metagenome]